MDTIDLCSGSEASRSPVEFIQNVMDFDFIGSLINMVPEVNGEDDNTNDEPPRKKRSLDKQNKNAKGSLEEDKCMSLVSDDENEPFSEDYLMPKTPSLTSSSNSQISQIDTETLGAFVQPIDTETFGAFVQPIPNENGTKRKGNNKKTTEKPDKEAEKREKALKKAAVQNHKSLRPGECMKYMTVEIDEDLLNSEHFSRVCVVLGATGVSVTPKAPIHCPSCVGWLRKQPRYLLNDEGQLSMNSESHREPHMLVVYTMQEMTQLLRSKTLNSRVSFLKESTKCQLTMLLYGAGQLSKGIFQISHLNDEQGIKAKTLARKQKSKNNARWKNTVRSRGNIEDAENCPAEVTENDLEYYLTKLLFEESTSCLRADTPEELAQLLLHFTKSIAEAPHKKAKHSQDNEADFYMRGDNRDCVKVDAHGNGLLRLWSQSLTKFPLAGLEMAQALCQRFPSPSSLMQTLDGMSADEAMNLLSEIPIRRAAGPLAAPRRLGPELAKKLLIYFTSTCGDQLLS